jgi:hypothetical protein
MNWLNSNRMIFTVVGIVAATVFSGGQMAIADFVICDPKPVDEAINYPGPAGWFKTVFCTEPHRLYQRSSPVGNRA